MGGPGSGRRKGGGYSKRYGYAKNPVQATALKRVAIKRMIRMKGGKVRRNASTKSLRSQRKSLYGY